MDGVRLDRSIVVKLERPDDTPSRKDGISVLDERRQRLHGIGLLHDVASVIASEQMQLFRTASVIFHRFFHQVSLRQHDVWSIAMASVALACKVEEVKISFREIIVLFHHLYRKRILCLSEDAKTKTLVSQYKAPTCKLSTSMTLKEKIELLQRSMTPLSPYGTIYKVWHDAMVQAESSLLRQLGFTLYWIPDSHPHSLIDPICEGLSDKVKTLSYEACDRTFYIDTCVRFDASTIAYASVVVAARREGVIVPRPPDCNLQDVADLVNWILGTYDPSNTDMQVARLCFVPSYIPNGSFNDPSSVSWEFVVDCMSNEKERPEQLVNESKNHV